MHTIKRGEPLPINQALNRPRAKLGLDLSTWMVIVFVTATAFLAGFRRERYAKHILWLAVCRIILRAWDSTRKTIGRGGVVLYRSR